MINFYVLLRSEYGIYSKHDREPWKYFEHRNDIDIFVFYKDHLSYIMIVR